MDNPPTTSICLRVYPFLYRIPVVISLPKSSPFPPLSSPSLGNTLTMKNWTVAICLLTASLSAWSSELYTPQPVLQGDDDKIVAKLRFDSPESGDLYLATIINGQLRFYSHPI